MISYVMKLNIERNIEMEKVLNEEKRQKFIEYAGKRVNNVLHDIQILEPMARSNSYDFTRKDVEDMFNAMQETLNEAKEEFNKKFDEKARAEKKVFSFSESVETQVMPEVLEVSEVEKQEVEKQEIEILDNKFDTPKPEMEINIEDN